MEHIAEFTSQKMEHATVYPCCQRVAGKDQVFKQCSGCKAVRYCGQGCQKHHWSSHKKLCRAIEHQETQKRSRVERGDGYVFVSQHPSNIYSGSGKFKVALNPLRRTFLNFAKSCILSSWLQFDNKKWGSPSSFLSYKRSKQKLRVFLAGHIVAMVTYRATKLTTTYSPMIVQFVDTMMLVSTSIEWL